METDNQLMINLTVMIGHLCTKADRIIEFLEGGKRESSWAETLVPVGLEIVKGFLNIFPPEYVYQPIHYPLSGDPEPTAQPDFNPLTPADREAVERWQETLNDSVDNNPFRPRERNFGLSGPEVEYEPGGMQRPVEQAVDNKKRRIVLVHLDNDCMSDWCIPENHPDHWTKEKSPRQHNLEVLEQANSDRKRLDWLNADWDRLRKVFFDSQSYSDGNDDLRAAIDILMKKESQNEKTNLLD